MLSIKQKHKLSFVSLFVFFFVFVFFVFTQKIEVVSKGEGVIAITDSNVEIYSPSSGVITSINANTGKNVKLGQELILFRNIEDLNGLYTKKANIASYSNKLDILNYEKTTIKKILSGSIYVLDKDEKLTARLIRVFNNYKTYKRDYEKLESTKIQYQLRKDNFLKQEELLGIKSNLILDNLGKTIRYVDIQIELNKVKQLIIDNESILSESKDLANRSHDTFQREALLALERIDDQIFDGMSSYEQNKIEKNAIEERIDQSKIISLVDGHVLSIKEGLSEGTFIERNTPLMTLKRNDEGVFIDAKFDSALRPFLIVGGPVKVRYNSSGYKGIYDGIIESISVDSFDYEESYRQGKRFYKVKIKETKPVSELKNLVGLNVSINAINGEITTLEYITGLLRKDISFNVW